MEINEESSLNRYLIYTNLPQILKNIKISKGNEKLITITKFTQNETEKFDEVFEKYGPFNKISKILFNSNKPIVGHNCLLDIFYLYQHFHTDLPEKLEDFKQNINEMFPSVYDTKLLSFNDRYLDQVLAKNERHLEKIYKTIIFNEANYRNPKIITKEINLQSPIQAHDAGYDAFMTGFIFLKLVCQFSNENTIFTNETLKSFESRMNMMKTSLQFHFKK